MKDLIPFNIEEAIEKDRVVTRDGQRVSQINWFTQIDDQFCVYGVMDKEVYKWQLNGSFNGGENPVEHACDLFLVPETKEMFINFGYFGAGYGDLTSALLARNDDSVCVLKVTVSGERATAQIVHDY